MENRDLIAGCGVSVWLSPDFATVRTRVASQDTLERPLFADPERAEELFHERRVAYALADHRIDIGPDEGAATVALRDTPEEALAGIEAAEAKCVANQHDTVFYIGGSSGNNLAAALTWDKNYTHLIGICAPTMVAQRSRIFQTSTVTGASPLLNITATTILVVDSTPKCLSIQITSESSINRKSSSS